MPHYHLNPSSDTVSRCKARTRPCPFGGTDKHFESEEAGRAFQEDFHRLNALCENKTGPTHLFTIQALNLPLATEQPDLDSSPPWWENDVEQYGKVWAGRAPELLGKLDLNGQAIAALWEDPSTDPNDVGIIAERGIACSKLVLKDWETGSVVGYVKAAYVNDESVQRSWGNDEDTALRYFREFDGSGRHMGIKYEDGEFVDYVERLRNEPENAVEIKRVLWTSFHKALGRTPEDYVKPDHARWLLVNLKDSDAPTDEAVLDKDLAAVREHVEKEFEEFKTSQANPSIDYALVDDEYRGQGLGPSMYVLAARRLACDDKTLRASGLQTQEAQRVWDRMAQDPGLPVRVQHQTWATKSYGSTVWKSAARLVLDFTENAA